MEHGIANTKIMFLEYVANQKIFLPWRFLHTQYSHAYSNILQLIKMSGSELRGQEAACMRIQAYVITTVSYLHG